MPGIPLGVHRMGKHLCPCIRGKQEVNMSKMMSRVTNAPGQESRGQNKDQKGTGRLIKAAR